MSNDLIKNTPNSIQRYSPPYQVLESVQKIPALLTECLSPEYLNNIDKIIRGFKKRNISKIILTGRGSSYFLTLTLKYLLKELTDFQVECHVTNLLENYFLSELDQNTAVFFHSTSGSSEGDLKVVKSAKEKGAYTIGVTDIPSSILAQNVDEVFHGPGGAKFELPATRTYATALFRMSRLIIEFSKEFVDQEITEKYLNSLLSFPKILEELIPHFETSAAEFASILDQAEGYFVIGNGPNISTAEETALAVSQCSGRIAASYEVENFIHGPIQPLTDRMGVIVIANEGRQQDRALRAAMTCKSIGAKTLVMTSENQKNLPFADMQISLPINIPESLSPLIYMVPGWQLAYQMGLFGKGCDLDRLSMDKPEFKNAFKFLMSTDKWVK